MEGGGLSIEELLAILRARRGRLPFEIGAFVALSAAEALLERPSEVGPEHVCITVDGTIALDATAPAASDERAARSLHRILTQLLLAAGGEVPPMMLELVENGPADGRFVLARLRDELEASLIPLNRAAARRVLARLIRDTAREAPRPEESVSATEVDDDLDRLLGRPSVDAALDDLLAGDAAPPGLPGAPVPPAMPEPVRPSFHERETPLVSSPELAPLRATVPDGAPRRKGFFADVGVDEAEVEAARRKSGLLGDEPPREPDEAELRPVELPKPTDARFEARSGGARGVDEDVSAPPRPRRSGAWTAVAVLALAAALAGAVVFVRPDLLAHLRGAPPAAPEAADGAEAPVATPVRAGHLLVHAAPEGAQVLLFVGRGPAVARGLPIGVAHEFVALADGHAPARAVVPSDATWSPDGPRSLYELALQAGSAVSGASAAEELGPTQLASESMGRPRGGRGDVRVITNPPGARVFMTIGFAPTTEVRDVPTDEGHELLVYAPGYEPRRVVVGPSDWTQVDGERRAEITVTLEPRRR